MKPRILYIEQARGFGGSVSVLANTAPYLRQFGYEVHVVLTSTDPRAVEALVGRCDEVYVLPYERRTSEVSNRLTALGAGRSLLKWPYLCWVTLREIVEELGWLLKLWKVLRDVRPCIEHGNNRPGSNRGALLLGRLLGMRCVASVRGGYGEHGWLGWLAVRLCDCEVHVSEHQGRSSTGARGKTLVLYDGLDMQQWPVPQWREHPRGVVRFGHVGMLTRWKGQHVFLRAALEVAERIPNTEFYLYGDVIYPGDEEYAAELRKIVAESSCGERIHFMGFQRNIQRTLRDLDVLVHSSIQPEPFGMVILEGMAAGLAVIASNAGGPREIICNGVDGVLVEPNSPELLADAMAQLAGDTRRIQLLGRQARRKVERQFTARRAAEELACLYDRIRDHVA